MARSHRNPDRLADSVVKRSKERFEDLVKNTYRVLLSRGMKGCFVHFLDKDTERFFRTRVETRYPNPDRAQLEVAESGVESA
jgi:DUF2075 family protein